MTKMIVSANYLDRSSKFPWLVRSEIETIDKVVQKKTLVSTGVRFTRSNAVEDGFGCSVVAQCETVEDSTNEIGTVSLFLVSLGAKVFPDNATRIRFNGSYFEDTTGRIVNGCKKLTLLPNRSMWAVDPIYGGR